MDMTTAAATNSEKNLICIQRCTKLNVKNADPPAMTAIQQSDATPPNMNRKKPHAMAAAKKFVKKNIVMMHAVNE